MNVLFNVDSKLGKLVTIGGKIAFSNEKNLSSGTSGSLNGEAYNTSGLGRVGLVLPPILSPYNNDGTYNLNGSAIGYANNIVGTSISYPNPLPTLDQNRSNTENNHVQSNAYIQFKPLNWITLKSTYGIDYLLVDNDLFQSPVSSDGYASSGNATSNFRKLKTWLWTNTAQFDHSFGGAHNVSLLLGQEQQRTTQTGYGLNRQTLSDPNYTVIQAGWVTSNASSLALYRKLFAVGFRPSELQLQREIFPQWQLAPG